MNKIKLTTTRLFVTAFLMCGIMTIQTQAAPGDLDASFGNGGRVTSADFYGRAIAIQADGRIIAAGSGSIGAISGVALERYNTDGSPDTSFGTNGRVVTHGGVGPGGLNVAAQGAVAVAIQADGKIIVVGGGYLYDNEGAYDYIVFILVKYNADGSLDTSFGIGGISAIPLGVGEGSVSTMAIQSDGKIVAAGYIRNTSWDFLVARYDSNGSLDASFGSGGKVRTSFGGIADQVEEVAIQTDGKIVAAGRNRNGTFQGPFIFNFALARYNTDGSLDSTFGTGGKVVTPFGYTLGAFSAAIQSDGKIVAVGDSGSDYHTGFALARYNTDGSLDNSFGSGGKVVTPFGNVGLAEAVAIQTDGKIVAAGYGYEGANSGIALARYISDGSLDISFGTGGKVVTPFNPGGGDGANDLAIQPDGKIIALAQNRFPNPIYALFRYQVRAESGFTVTRSDDRNNGVCVPGDCSLREAVNAANASGGDDTINFASGLTTITLTNEIVINNAGALTINGLGSNVLTIDGGAGTNRIFYTNNAIVTISGVILTGGGGTGATNSGSGGAISAIGGSLTLDGVNVRGNRTSNTGIGGGLLFAGGTHRLINSTVSNNLAINGGGGIFNVSTLEIINSTISDNSAYPYGGPGGGGISNSGTINLRNATMTNNTATEGGGIDQRGGSLNFGNTIVAGNIATKSNIPEISAINFAITSAGGNLFGDSPGDSANIPIVFQPTDIRDTNPLLDALQNNGGTTPTRALLAGSPIIDKGLNTLVSPLASAFDQRGTGFARIRDGNGDNIATVDIGAFEVQTATRRTPFDFDGDGRADISVFRPSDRTWYLNRSTQGFSATQFGLSTDKITPADYDGDGKTDIAVFRDGFWYWFNSSNGNFNAIQFGIASDIPVPADFTGDGRAELGVYRNGVWWSLNLANNQVNTIQFGFSTDKPVIADYDGDGRADQAVYRNGEWHLNQSTQGYAVVPFGLATDKPVVGDYDGDGKADLAVYRDGTWYVLQSTNGFTAFQFGIASDIPAPADYDGDGKTDAAVYRDGTWWILQSTSGVAIQQFGLANDKPVPAAFLP